MVYISFSRVVFFFKKKTDQTVPTKADITLPLKFYSSAFFFCNLEKVLLLCSESSTEPLLQPSVKDNR